MEVSSQIQLKKTGKSKLLSGNSKLLALIGAKANEISCNKAHILSFQI